MTVSFIYSFCSSGLGRKCQKLVLFRESEHDWDKWGKRRWWNGSTGGKRNDIGTLHTHTPLQLLHSDQSDSHFFFRFLVMTASIIYISAHPSDSSHFWFIERTLSYSFLARRLIFLITGNWKLVQSWSFWFWNCEYKLVHMGFCVFGLLLGWDGSFLFKVSRLVWRWVRWEWCWSCGIAENQNWPELPWIFLQNMLFPAFYSCVCLLIGLTRCFYLRLGHVRGHGRNLHSTLKVDES